MFLIETKSVTVPNLKTFRGPLDSLGISHYECLAPFSIFPISLGLFLLSRARDRESRAHLPSFCTSISRILAPNLNMTKPCNHHIYTWLRSYIYNSLPVIDFILCVPMWSGFLYVLDCVCIGVVVRRLQVHFLICVALWFDPRMCCSGISMLVRTWLHFVQLIWLFDGHF